MSTSATRAAGPVTEKFAASAGRWLGVAAMVMGLALVVGSVWSGLADTWRIASFGVALTALTWAVMVRPSVSAHQRGLLLRNVLRDVCVPWGSIERCRALQTLQVATPEGIVHGLGVSRSARSLMRQQVGGRTVIGTMLGRGRSTPQPTGRAKEEVQTSLSYAEFVESRIVRLAEDSRDEPAPVVTSWAPVPIGALVLAAVAAVVPLVA